MSRRGWPNQPAAPSRSNVSPINFGLGSWSCDNAETGSLTGLDCSATRLREILEHILPISSATQTDAAQSIVSARGPARKAKVRARHALTAAIIGLTPTIFSTRVTL
jgi:hypothetical protein